MADVVLREHPQLSQHQARALADLLGDAAITVPFLCRYRKEVHGSLDPEQLRRLRSELGRVEELRARREKLWARLHSENPAQATRALQDMCNECSTVEALDALLKPFLPSSTKPDTPQARAAHTGLLAAVDLVWNGCPGEAAVLKSCVKRHPSEFPSPDDARALVVQVLALRVAALEGAVEVCRGALCGDATLTTALVSKRDKTAKIVVHGREMHAGMFEGVAGKTFHLSRIAPHSVLAIQRGEQAKLVRVAIALGKCTPRLLALAKKAVCKSLGRTTLHPLLDEAVRVAVEELVPPALKAEAKKRLVGVAHAESARVFCANLRQRLLTQPLRDACVLGIDPGFRHGCKCCCVGPTGAVLDTFVIYPLKPQAQMREAKARLLQAIQDHHVTAIAIGNGCGCKEAQALASSVVGELASPDSNSRRVRFVVVDEAGSSVYSASKVQC